MASKVATGESGISLWSRPGASCGCASQEGEGGLTLGPGFGVAMPPGDPQASQFAACMVLEPKRSQRSRRAGMINGCPFQDNLNLSFLTVLLFRSSSAVGKREMRGKAAPSDEVRGASPSRKSWPWHKSEATGEGAWTCGRAWGVGKD